MDIGDTDLRKPDTVRPRKIPRQVHIAFPPSGVEQQPVVALRAAVIK